MSQKFTVLDNRFKTETVLRLAAQESITHNLQNLRALKGRLQAQLARMSQLELKGTRAHHLRLKVEMVNAQAQALQKCLANYAR